MERRVSYDPELLDQVFEMNLKGYSNEQMAEKLGLSIGTIDRIYYKVLGLTRRPFKKRALRTNIDPEVEKKVIHLFRWGYNPREIYEDVGIRLEHVNRIIENETAESRIARSNI